MFNTLGVVLYCLLGACPVFVAGTGREMRSLYIDELTYNTNTSGSVPERSGFSSIPISTHSPQPTPPLITQLVFKKHLLYSRLKQARNQDFFGN